MRLRLITRSAAAILVATILFASGIAYASAGRTLEVTFLPGVKFVLDNKRLTAGNDQGMYVEGKNRYPNHVMYNGNVYVPLRLVEEAFGKQTSYHAESKTVYLGSHLISHKVINPEQAPPAIKNWVQHNRKVETAQSKTLGQKSYLLVTRGEKPTGGYGVDITRVEDLGHEVLVTFKYTEPSGMVTQAVTYPSALAEIPRTDKPVRFVGEKGQHIPQLPSVIDFRKLNPEQAPAEINKLVQRSLKMELAQSKTLGNKTYLLVTRGEKRTGGYDVAITRVEDRGHEVLVTVKYTEPSGMVTQAVTYPNTLVEIPRTDKPVRFVGEKGQLVPQLPLNQELQKVANGTTNIKLYSLRFGTSELTVTGLANFAGAKLEYEVKNQHGTVVRKGAITPNSGAQIWTPYTITIPRTDFGSGERISIAIIRTANNGSKETFRMSAFQQVK